jgi:hypothetical protein
MWHDDERAQGKNLLVTGTIFYGAGIHAHPKRVRSSVINFGKLNKGTETATHTPGVATRLCRSPFVVAGK